MKIFGRNVSKTCLSMLMIIVCLGTSLLFLGINADAKTIKMGTVTASSLHLRADAGKDYAHITYLYKGDKGIIVGEKKASSGTITSRNVVGLLTISNLSHIFNNWKNSL